MNKIKLSYKEIQELRSRHKNNVRFHLNKASVVKKCEYCGNLYTPTHHSQKFCDKNCYRKHRQDYKAKWKREKYQHKQSLGTGYINATPHKDFDEEHKILMKEFRRLGIKRKR